MERNQTIMIIMIDNGEEAVGSMKIGYSTIIGLVAAIIIRYLNGLTVDSFPSVLMLLLHNGQI